MKARFLSERQKVFIETYILRMEGALDSFGAPVDADLQTDLSVERWDRLRSELETPIEQAVAGGGDRGQVIASRWSLAHEAAGSSDFDRAIAIAERLKNNLANPNEADTRLGAIPENTVAFAKAAITWRQARSRAESELTRLQGEIRKRLMPMVAEIPEAAQLIEECDALTDRLRALDVNLDDLLDELASADPGSRPALRRTCAAQAATCRDLLSVPFFIDIDAANGIGAAEVAKPLNSALRNIETLLASA